MRPHTLRTGSLVPRLAGLALLLCGLLPTSGAAQVEWWNLNPGSLHPGGSRAMAPDPVAGRMIMFGGSLTGTPARGDRTWQWDGNDWHELDVGSTLPPGRTGHTMVFDPIRNRTLMFGGWGLGGPLGDLWAWDGVAWTEIVTAGPNPSPRSDAAVAFDSVRDRLVVFGGYDGNSQVRDTWEWDGTSWTQFVTFPWPSVARGSPMVYDSVRQEVVLYPGNGSTPPTWTWDGATWTRHTNTITPHFLARAMTFDSVRGRVVLYGGTRGISEIWEWDGSLWSLRATGGPALRTLFAIGFDAARGLTLMCGGYRTGPGYLNDTWAWDGTNWTVATPAQPIAPVRGHYEMVFDTSRSRTVLVGRRQIAPVSPQVDTWDWDGATWSPAAPGGPSDRVGFALVYENARARTLLFGGRSDTGAQFADTWEWNGAAWAQLTPANAPPARSYAAYAHDYARQRTVLFGGADAQSPQLGDTWEWDGLDWTLQTPSTAPVPLRAATAAYDPISGRVVLFGGYDSTGWARGDTWAWDGTNWQLIATTGPQPRGTARMCFDSGRGRLVLTGGVAPCNPPGCVVEYNDTWEWTGSAWVQQLGQYGPGPLLAMAFDEAANRVVAFDATRTTGSPNGDLANTWFFGVKPPTPQLQSVGNACSGSSPILHGNSPSIRNPTFQLGISRGSAGAIASIGVAFTQTSTSLPGGCALHLGSPIVPLPLLLDGSGNGTVPIPLAYDTSLLGLAFYAQGFVADPASPTFGIGFTRGLAFVIGE